MRILVTAGPTREYIDTVRFISNASSGRMGLAVAAAAIETGHVVTLLLGPGVTAPVAADGVCDVAGFVSVDDLKSALHERFDACDALVMAAAVGDFRPETRAAGKLSRKAGPVTLRLVGTEDVLASLAGRKRPGQTVIAFAVEDGPEEQIESKARAELADKGADFVVVNSPAAMAASESYACILAADRTVLPWATRPKGTLAGEIIRLMG